MAKTAVKSTSKEIEKSNTKTKEAVKAQANQRLVAAIKEADGVKEQYATCLVAIGEIAQSESLSRPEVVLSLMEARGVSKATAESQYSRMKKLISDPQTLQDLKDGKLTLKEATAKVTKKQDAPNKEKQKDNAEKRFNRSLTGLIEAAKDQGIDLQSLVMSVKASAKKAGIK